MPSRSKLTAEQIQDALAGLPGWTLADGKLHREYAFPDFTHAFGFMAAAATRIEAMNHHPEWFNVYSKVIVDLHTHDVDGITAFDVDLADRLEGIAAKLLA
ncbi:MAG: 4a-hydroxytetrahydrobiopterin dehydratase [Acidobacteria bacterium]|nr:4a-hydroxytetrahydrobiopterin dehydratase [Acidobacteriota bacterium]